MAEIECPNHEGGFDCPPFCGICEGDQYYEEDEEWRVKRANGTASTQRKLRSAPFAVVAT